MVSSFERTTRLVFSNSEVVSLSLLGIVSRVHHPYNRIYSTSPQHRFTPEKASLDMGRKYLGGTGNRLTVWISIAASTVLVFYGYDQVSSLFA